MPKAQRAAGTGVFKLILKEFVMNKTQELELVDLGDVKEVTLGPISPLMGEDHPVLIFRDQ